MATFMPLTEKPGSFDPDNYDWRSHLKSAIADLKVKGTELDRYWAYYEGDHPRVWLTEKIRDMFDDQLVDSMVENWCETVIDHPLTRMEVTGFDAKDSVNNKAAQNVFDENDLELEQTDLYRHMRVYGEGFLFAWKDDEKEFGFSVSLNEPKYVWWPADAHRTQPKFVVKVWPDELDGCWRATLYYKYEVIRLKGVALQDGVTPIMPEANGFLLDEDDPGGPHQFEEVPVIRFAKHRKRRSVLKSIIPIQNKINKLSANKMVSAEFGAYRRLAILTQQPIAEDDLVMRPNRALVLDPGGGTDAEPTSIWEGSATELANFDNSGDKEIDKIFSMVPLPRHLRMNPGTPPSGDAIQADEGPFVEMIEDMQRYAGASWSNLWDLMGIEADAQWRNPNVKSDVTEATVVKTYKDAGVPVEFLLEKYAGWSTDEVEELVNRPLSPDEVNNAISGLSTGVALGGVDPNHARETITKMMGSRNNGNVPQPKQP